MIKQLIKGRGIHYSFDVIDDIKYGWKNIDIRIQIDEKEINLVDRQVLLHQLNELKQSCESMKAFLEGNKNE